MGGRKFVGGGGGGRAEEVEASERVEILKGRGEL